MTFQATPLSPDTCRGLGLSREHPSLETSGAWSLGQRLCVGPEVRKVPEWPGVRSHWDRSVDLLPASCAASGWPFSRSVFGSLVHDTGKNQAHLTGLVWRLSDLRPPHPGMCWATPALPHCSLFPKPGSGSVLVPTPHSVSDPPLAWGLPEARLLTHPCHTYAPLIGRDQQTHGDRAPPPAGSPPTQNPALGPPSGPCDPEPPLPQEQVQ